MSINNEFLEHLKYGQITNFYKERKKWVGKYLALWTEHGNLNKYMVTLSPIQNTMTDTLKLRKHFLTKLSNRKNYLNKKNNSNLTVGYFSSIEMGLNMNAKENEYYQQNNMYEDNINLHIHIQLLTDLCEEDIRKVMGNLDYQTLTFHNHLTIDKSYGKLKFNYVIKDLKNIDWKKVYLAKTLYKGVNLYSTSRKSVPNYFITKIWFYFRKNHKIAWKNLKDKYSFLLDSKNNGDILFNNNIKNIQGFKRVTIKQKRQNKTPIYHYVHIKEDIL